MDYDHVWTNSAGNASPTFGNKFPHTLSFCPEPYPRKNVNTPSRHTHKCSRFRNFLSEPCPSSAVNQNVRYHPYQPLVTSFQKTDCRRPKTCHRGPYGPEIEEQCLCCPQKMHSNIGKGNCNGIINHFKSNGRQKLPKTKIKGKGSFQALNIDNNCQANYAVNVIDNDHQANYAANAIDNNHQANYAVNTIDNNRQSNYVVNATDNKRHANYAVSPIDNNLHINYAVSAIDNHHQANYTVNAIDNHHQANYAVNAIDNNINYAVNAIDNNHQANYAFTTIDNNHQANYVIKSIDNNRQTNYPVNAIDNNQQANNSTANATEFTYVSNKEVLVKIEEGENSCSKLPTTNEQNYANGNDCSYGDTIKVSINNTKTSPNYANEIENINLIAKNIGLNPEYQNDPLLNNVTNAPEDNTTDLVFADSMTNAGINSLQAMNNLDISGCQITHITIPEITSSNAQDIQVETSEYTDIDSNFFKTIFEGKDENGDDIVVLLADSGMQQMINDEINTDTVTYNENLKTGINQDDAFNATENNVVTDQTSSEFRFDTQQVDQNDVLNSTRDNTVSDQISSEFPFDTQQTDQDDTLNSTSDNKVTDQTSVEFYFDTQQIKQNHTNDHSQEVIFSHIDDHASEEIVITSKASKSKKKKNDINTDRKQETTVKQAAVKNNATSDCVSEPSSSRKTEEIFTGTAQSVDSSGKKRRLQLKSDESLCDIQREYFEKILNKVKMENKLLMADERFWNMYRIIVNKIGGNVMETIYSMLPALIHNYEASEQKTTAATSKSKVDKKRLRVKLSVTPKKRKDSENC